jgi:uncharacterized membrane protein
MGWCGMRHLCRIFLIIGMISFAGHPAGSEAVSSHDWARQFRLENAPKLPNFEGIKGFSKTFGSSGLIMEPSGFAPILPQLGGGMIFTPETPGDATLSLCNRTGEELQIAVRLRENDSWVRRGWLHLASGDCTRFSGQAVGEAIFYLALSPTRTFGGKQMFCITRERSFRLLGGDCPEGHREEGFRGVRLTEGLMVLDIN